VETSEAIETRRSVHDYTDDPIEDAALERIFDRVRHTPSGYNLQPWEFLVLREADTKQRLRGVANDQEHVTEAAAAVVVLGNTDPAAHAQRVFDDWLDKGYLPDAETRDGLIDHVESWRDRPSEANRVWTTRSTALAAMTLMYAAWDEGIASCPMEGFDPDALVDEFDIDGYEPVMLVTLGYPSDDATDLDLPRKERRPIDEIVHHESFGPDA
jgi:nitroreductase